MIQTLLIAVLLSLFPSPRPHGISNIADPHQAPAQYQRGKLLADLTLSPGGQAVPLPFQPAEMELYIIAFSGTLSSPGGRAADALYVYADPYAPEFLPRWSAFVSYIVDDDNFHKGSESFFVGVFGRPKHNSSGHYDIVSRLPKAKVLKALIPETYWDYPRDKPKDYLSGGTLRFQVFEALPGDAAKRGFECIDGHEALDATPVREVTRFPIDGLPSNARINILASLQPKVACKGVAADSASLIILRAFVPAEGKVKFALEQQDGAVYPLVGNPWTSAGGDAVEADTRDVRIREGADKIDHVAFALYRPPSYPGRYLNNRVTFKIDFTPRDPAKGTYADETVLQIVRPPVVLVHGTYDKPSDCWQQITPKDQSLMSMEGWLKAIGFDYVFCVDWEETNGHKDPSAFTDNQMTVLRNKNGIADALNKMRSDGYAVTQADVICHSQGGVIARVFARGFSLDTPLPASHAHFNDPAACERQGCWYHAPETYGLGYIHRLITLSSTHMGSDVCRLFLAYDYYRETIRSVKGLWLGIFNWYVDNFEQATTTKGFLNQAPGSPELQKIGPTPVPSHAIAGVCSLDEYFNQYDGFYYKRLYKIWYATPINALYQCLDDLNQGLNAARIRKLYDSYGVFSTLTNEKLAPLLEELRMAVFADQENDCTVGKLSSWGGMEEPFRSRIPNVLHSYEPRYPSVQRRVAELLVDDGGLFDPRGFPDAYAKTRTELPKFEKVLGWSRDSAIAGRPWQKLPSVTDPGNNGSFIAGSESGGTSIGRGSASASSGGDPAGPIPETNVSLNAERFVDDYKSKWTAADYNGAMNSLAAAVKDSPNSPKLRSIYASALQATGKLPESEAQAKQAVTLEPRNALLRAGHGNTLYALGKHVEAEAEYREGLRLNPNSPECIAGLGLAQLGQGKSAEAEASFRQAIRIAPAVSDYQGFVGNALTYQGKWEDAWPFYVEALRLNKDSALAHAGIGLVLFIRTKYDDSERETAAAVRLAPNVGLYRINHAAALYMLSRLPEAKSEALEAKRLGISSHWVFEKLGLK